MQRTFSTLPDLEDLRCFVEAARLLNFRAAARAVALTPAALGQRIAKLEGQIGARLFHRTTRSVVLTERGLALLPFAEKALGAAEDCIVASGQVTPPLEVTLGTRHELGLSWLVPMLPKLLAARANLTVHLYFGSGPDLLQRVRTLGIDCAISSARLHDSQLAFEPLHEETYVFVGHKKLLARTPLSKPSDAGRHTLIDTTEGLPLFAYLKDATSEELTFARVLRMGTISAIRTLVLAGEGVAVLPRYFVASDLARGMLVRLLPKIEPRNDAFRLVFRADDPRRAVFSLLSEVMRKETLR